MIDRISRMQVADILDKMQFFQGQRAGRELWFDKSKAIQEEDLKNFNNDIQKIRKYVSDTNIGKWIPVSERLPDKEGSYLVTTKMFSDFIVMYAYYSDNLQNFICNGTPVAWMPLPEPYKGGENGDHN